MSALRGFVSAAVGTTFYFAMVIVSFKLLQVKASLLLLAILMLLISVFILGIRTLQMVDRRNSYQFTRIYNKDKRKFRILIIVLTTILVLYTLATASLFTTGAVKWAQMQANKKADNRTVLNKVVDKLVDKFLDGRLNKTGCGKFGFKKCETETEEEGEKCSFMDKRRGRCGEEKGTTEPSNEGDGDNDSAETVDTTESDEPADDDTVNDDTVDPGEEETPATEATVALPRCTMRQRMKGQCDVTCSCDRSKRDAPEPETTEPPEPGTVNGTETDQESTRKERFRAFVISKVGKIGEIFFLFIDIKDQLLYILITSSVLLWFSAAGHIAHLVILILYDTTLDYIYIYYPGTSIEMDCKPVTAVGNSKSAPNGAPV